MTLKELREKYEAAASKANAIAQGAHAAGRELTDDEVAKVEAFVAEANQAKADIAALERREAVSAGLTSLTSAQAPGRKTAPDTLGVVAGTGNTHTYNESNTAVISNVRDRVNEDPKRGWRHEGEFAMAVAMASAPGARPDERLLMATAGDPTQQMSIGPDGGHLVPPAFSSTIYDGAIQQDDSIISLCDRITIPNGVESLTFPANAETSRADGSRAGGVRGYWRDELGQMNGSKVTFREVKLEPKELYVFVYASDKLLRHASALQGYISARASEEINFKVGNAILNGTGSGQPRGILAASNPKIAVSKETGQAADTVVKANIDKMWQRVLPNAKASSSGVWLYDSSVLQQLNSMTLAAGTGGVPVYMPPGGLSAAPYGTIFGKQARPCEYSFAVGDEGDIGYYDLKQYALAVRGGIESAMSMHLKFDHAQTAFRFTFEVDGQPWLASAITPFTPSGGTTKTETLSPFVTIAARA